MNCDINNLDWKPHPNNFGGEMAIVKFDNGYSASCLRGGMFYTSNGTYEIAVLDDHGIVYNTPITDDVLGYLSEEEANQALKDISELPAKRKD